MRSPSTASDELLLHSNCLRPVVHQTRALFVGNVGETVALPAHVVAQFCTVEGIPAKVHVPDPSKTFMYVTFETEELARCAKTVLMDVAIVGRPLTVKYADLHPKAARSMEKTEVPHVYLDLTSEDAGIPGLVLHHDFLSAAEESEILEKLAEEEWKDLAKRQVCHFGHAFEYMTRSVSSRGCNGPIPPYAEGIKSQIEALPDIPQLDQLTVNKYPAGVGLSPHVDAHSAFTGSITSLSLGSAAVMEFRRGDVRKSVLLPRRSLVVMSHECRYAWEHYIPHRKTDNINGEVIPREAFRVSLTFRKARGFPCTCGWPDMCDSQNSPLPPTRLLQLRQQQQPCSVAEAACCCRHHSTTAGASAVCEGAQRAVQEEGMFCSGMLAPTRRHEVPRHSAAQAVCESLQSQGCSACCGAPELDTAAAADEPDAPRGHEDSCQQQAAAMRSSASLEQASGSEAGPQACTESGLRQLEVEHVHRVYEAIAPHFSATRFAVWPAVRAFIESLPSGAVVADVGCGNGKYFGVRPDVVVLASDRSEGLVRVALQRAVRAHTGQPPMPAADVFIADGMVPAYRHCSCDAVLCIAVLHHISSPQRRALFLRGLRDVLVVGGRALVTVWATEQEKPASTVAKWTPLDVGKAVDGAADQPDRALLAEAEHAADYFVPWHLPFHRAGACLAAVKSAGCTTDTLSSSGCEPVHACVPKAAVGVIDNQKQTVKFNRYYHLFAEGELQQLVESIKGVVVRQGFYDASNWVIDFERVS